MPRLLVFFALALSPGSDKEGFGLSRSENFVVSAESQLLAQEVLERAESLRKQIALEWIGEELASGAGASIVHVQLSDSEDDGLTWVMDGPKRNYHVVWMTTTRERALGSGLAHEITHTVIATRFPGKLPAWADEGVASFQDNEERQATRRRILESLAKTGRWPSLDGVLSAKSMSANDQMAYATACSLTEYLLGRSNRTKFLDFAIAGKVEGWDAALLRFYGLRNVQELEVSWQSWVSQRTPTNTNSSRLTEREATPKAGVRK